MLKKMLILFVGILFIQCDKDEDSINIIDDSGTINPEIENPETENSNVENDLFEVEKLTFNEDVDLITIHFINNDVGFIGGGDILNNSATIFKTDNGGKTWDEVFTSDGFYINKIVSSPDGTIYAIGSKGAVLVSNSSGNDWKKIDDIRIGRLTEDNPNNPNEIEWVALDHSYYLTDIIFTNNNIGFLIGSIGEEGQFFKFTSDPVVTTSGYPEWALRDVIELKNDRDELLKNNTLNGIVGIDETTFLVSGGEVHSNGTMLRSINAGESWERVVISENIGISKMIYTDNISFIVGKSGLSSDDVGGFFMSNDKGSSWNLQEGYDERKLNAIDVLNNKICLIGENNTWVDQTENTYGDFISISTDEGNTWNRVSHGVRAGWSDVSFISENKILVVGFNGKALIVDIIK